MELKRPVPTGTTSEMANALQHEAAMRVQARMDAEEALKRRMAKGKALRSGFSMVAMVLVLGGGVWAWRSGLLDSSLDKQPEAPQAPVAEVVPQSAAAKKAAVQPAAEPAPVAGKAAVKKVPAPAVVPAQPVPVADSKLHAATLAKFAGATVAYWKNAVAEDRPGKDRKLAFTGFVPKDGGYDLLEIEMGDGFAVERVTKAGVREPLDRKAFDALTAQTPYLVVREGRAYYCSAGQKKAPESFPLPEAGAFNPSREEFGLLMRHLDMLQTKKPGMRYDVSLVIENLRKEVPVATVGHGESVARLSFEQAVRKLVPDADLVKTFLAAAKVRVKPAK